MSVPSRSSLRMVVKLLIFVIGCLKLKLFCCLAICLLLWNHQLLVCLWNKVKLMLFLLTATLMQREPSVLSWKRCLPLHIVSLSIACLKSRSNWYVMCIKAMLMKWWMCWSDHMAFIYLLHLLWQHLLRCSLSKSSRRSRWTTILLVLVVLCMIAIH